MSEHEISEHKISEHTAVVTWARSADVFSDKRFSRVHTWTFDGGASVAASASPAVVPQPYSNPENIDPEEAFVAALSSCHMLTFLYLAADKGFVVEHYRDEATGKLGKNRSGRLALTQVTLSPEVRYGGDSLPTAEEDRALHHQAHEACYLANTVRCAVGVLPVSNALVDP